MARTSAIRKARYTQHHQAPSWKWRAQDNVIEDTVSKDGRVELPGFGAPVNYGPDGCRDYSTSTYMSCPNALQDWAAEPFTVRERSMMQMINAITDKPEWRRKVFDEAIVQKWRTEAVREEGQGFTENMFDYCIAELRDKAENEDSDMVAVLDSEWAVVKSDDLVPDELREELKAAVAPLESVPDHKKDWHPGSDEQVLDLVHPSLFPLLYGRSRILPTGTVDIHDCIQSCGKGEIVPSPNDDDVRLGDQRSWLSYSRHSTDFWSKRFQWLPCDVAFRSNDDVEITSYINNLHPGHHSNLYRTIEKLVARCVPVLSKVLSSYGHKNAADMRVPMTETQYEFPHGEEPPEGVGGNDEDSDQYWVDREQWVRTAELVFQGGARPTPELNKALEEAGYGRQNGGLHRWVHDNRVLIKPDAREYDGPRGREVEPLDLRTHFARAGIQVIVKLANIHLTPSKPHYSGGSWHIEGQLNERICATALYYYDNDNITDSHLAFRTKVSTDDITSRDYGQDDNEGVCYLFDIERDGPGIQDIGRVLTREGRLLAFPNVLQHQVQPFQLADPTKPGHRKILALFLVDPFQRVISTANVPPQQREWWADALHQESEGGLSGLPAELRQQVLDEVTDFPIGLKEAKMLRGELMEERGRFVVDVNGEFERETFAFCEH